MTLITRRTIILGCPPVACALVVPRNAHAEPAFKLKFANSIPTNHPLNTRMVEAGKQITEQTAGQVD